MSILTIIHHLHQKNIRLVSVLDPWTETNNDFNDVLFSITSWMAKGQSDHKSKATKAGIARKRLEGKGKRGKDKKKRVRRWLKRPRISTPEGQA